MSKNLKNSHFLQSRTKIVLIEIKFAKFWNIGELRAPVLRTYFYIIRHALKPKHKIHFWTFYVPMYQCAGQKVGKKSLVFLWKIEETTTSSWNFLTFTAIIFQKSTVVAGMLGLVVAVYVSLAEYYLTTMDLDGDLKPTSRNIQLPVEALQNLMGGMGGQ